MREKSKSLQVATSCVTGSMVKLRNHLLYMQKRHDEGNMAIVQGVLYALYFCDLSAVAGNEYARHGEGQTSWIDSICGVI